jgi:hypothetical protein
MGCNRRSRRHNPLPGSAVVPVGRQNIAGGDTVVQPTARNLQATGKVRLGIGPTRDVVLIEGTVQALAADEIPDAVGDAFATKTGFDPRQLNTTYLYFRVHPQRLQAWREANELDGRELMRSGLWLID